MRRHRLLLSVLLTVALLTVACGGDDEGGTTTAAATSPAEAAGDSTPPASTDDSSVDDAGFEARVEQAAQTMLERGSVNGATAVHVAISDPDQGSVTVALGTLAADGAEAASADDVFPIGSITKTFTATVILQMVEQEFALDDRIEDLVPDLTDASPELAGLTVRQLLSMTSGIADYLNVPDSVVTEIVDDPTEVWELKDYRVAGRYAVLSAPSDSPGSTTKLHHPAVDRRDSPLAEPSKSWWRRRTSPSRRSRRHRPPSARRHRPSRPHTRGYLAGGCVAELAADGATSRRGPVRPTGTPSFTPRRRRHVLDDR